VVSIGDLHRFGGASPRCDNHSEVGPSELAPPYGLTVPDLTGGESDPRRLDFWTGEEVVGMEAIKGSDWP
jgi:hypothetical protein